jgi:hypothetical protein
MKDSYTPPSAYLLARLSFGQLLDGVEDIVEKYSGGPFSYWDADRLEWAARDIRVKLAENGSQQPKLTNHELKMAAQKALEDAPVEGERYQHYKGDYYRVVCTSVKEDTLEPLITYKSEKYKVNFTRTLKVWRETVIHEGKRVPRFKKVST